MWVNRRFLPTLLIIVVGAGVCAFLLWGGARWPSLQATTDIFAGPSQEAAKGALSLNPFLELLKLTVAFLLGIVVTAVHKYYHRDRLLSRSLEHAETLLCVAAALMMIVIGGNTARALGVFGAASLIRFRTPVEDPKDTTILFILLGIGMSCGIGLFEVAVLATLALCLFLFILGHLGEQKPRVMEIELKAHGSEFPKSHVENIFAAYGAVYEPREVSQGKDISMRYHVVLEPNTPLEAMSEQLMAGGYSGIKSINWETPKKRD